MLLIILKAKDRETFFFFLMSSKKGLVKISVVTQWGVMQPCAPHSLLLLPVPALAEFPREAFPDSATLSSLTLFLPSVVLQSAYQQLRACLAFVTCLSSLSVAGKLHV